MLLNDFPGGGPSREGPPLSFWEYHEATKHTPEKLRRSARALDWASMPEPFRHYEGVPLVDLPAEPVGDGAVASLSRLLFHAAAVSATRVAPSGTRYALRVNPSSGNLHPTEFHFVTRGLSGWADGLYHYRPSSHMVEQRALGAVLEGDAPLDFVLTSIAWREAWKYGERAYRYCLLDMGHAWIALVEAAASLGCVCMARGSFDDDAVAQACGLSSDEWPLLRVEVRGGFATRDGGEEVQWFGGKANRLSPVVLEQPGIVRVHEATKAVGEVWERSPGARGLVEWARGRRSALDFRGGDEQMSGEVFRTLMGLSGRVRLFAFVHRVAGMEPGLYGPEGEVLRLGDQRPMAAGLSLGQDLAGNSCVTFAMVADFEGGERGYRYAHFEAGAIGQWLYLEAEKAGLRGTGIGAFFDDRSREYLGTAGQVIYHFAVGYPVEDTR